MGGKKGMTHYGKKIKNQIKEEYETGSSIKALSQKYGISRWSIHCWCGLSEKTNMKQAWPLPKGRPRKEAENQERLIERLQMENELLRNFLSTRLPLPICNSGSV